MLLSDVSPGHQRPASYDQRVDYRREMVAHPTTWCQYHHAEFATMADIKRLALHVAGMLIRMSSLPCVIARR